MAFVFVLTVVVIPVAEFLITTSAVGTTAPEASVIVPDKVPPATCACNDGESRRESPTVHTISANLISFWIIRLSLLLVVNYRLFTLARLTKRPSHPFTDRSIEVQIKFETRRAYLPVLKMKTFLGRSPLGAICTNWLDTTRCR